MFVFFVMMTTKNRLATATTQAIRGETRRVHDHNVNKLLNSRLHFVIHKITIYKDFT
ncbi:hypothetical protein AB00_2089 [Raoultella ornithinolytica 2-156-04_S1_C1]|nr:hypothetical protein AB00_2089 [Raoultella ornithinolytica 2-156-04_S1_C1]